MPVSSPWTRLPANRLLCLRTADRDSHPHPNQRGARGSWSSREVWLLGPGVERLWLPTATWRWSGKEMWISEWPIEESKGEDGVTIECMGWTTRPGVWTVLMGLTLAVTTILRQSYVSPHWLQPNRSVFGSSFWHSDLLVSPDVGGSSHWHTIHPPPGDLLHGFGLAPSLVPLSDVDTHTPFHLRTVNQLPFK